MCCREKCTSLADPARSPTHRRPGSPIKTVRHRSNMKFLPEGWVCLMIKRVIWNVYKVHGRQLLKLGFSTIYNQNYLRLHLLVVNKSKTYSPHNAHQYNTIRKLYVSKMNENKQIIPTKYTRNPPDHRHRRQITIFNPKHCCQISFLESCYFNGTGTVSTHVCICKI